LAEEQYLGMSEPSPVTRYDPFDGALSLSLATRVGGLVCTSGMIGLDAEFNVPGDLEEEFRSVFAALGGILESMGTSLQHVTEMTNFFTGDFGANYPIFNKVRGEVFGKNLPASTSVQVASLLHPAAHVEVKMVAAVPEG
jgi:2-iminobutanoate/2-iminopropanoate deaminase